VLAWFKRVLEEYRRRGEETSSLAGIAWWQWSDTNQFSRGLPAVMHGLLNEGLVDGRRKPGPMYDEMAEIFRLMDKLITMDEYEVTVQGNMCLDIRQYEHRGIPLALDALRSTAEQDETWNAACAQWSADFESMLPVELRVNRIPDGPYLRNPLAGIGRLEVDLSGRPLILSGGCNRIKIPVGFAVDTLYFLGHSTFYNGYPVRGELYEQVARYELHFEDGSVQTIPLRNGVELLTASTLHLESRIQPLSPVLIRALDIKVNGDFEYYSFYCFVCKPEKHIVLSSITFERLDESFSPMLYGITALEARNEG
jgi:hypothetical protein